MFDNLTGYQKELIAHIEFMGRFYGLVSRLDLTSRFEVSDATATRIFNLYNKLAPNNIIYRPNLKRYEWQDNATPIVPVSTFKCTSTLVTGFGDSYANIEGGALAVKNSLFNVDLQILSYVTRAIKRRQVLKILYLSKSTPDGIKREIVPHSIVDSGLRWHVRAFDRKSNQFRDFVINRIKSVVTVPKALIPEVQTVRADSDWNNFIQLKIQAHPNLGNATKIIEYEYRMSSGTLDITVRKALAGYLLDTWNIDTSSNAELSGKHILLHLKNTDELDSSSKRLAPSVMDEL